MTLALVSFIAGVLTVLAPCILPILPIIIGKSVEDTNKRRPLIIIGSLAVSIILFTLLLKSSTLLIDIPPKTWSFISGFIILFFGVSALFPGIWSKLVSKVKFSAKSDKFLYESSQKKTLWGDIMMGAALGPVFSSCSPTYFLILATVLPQNYFVGIIYLLIYAAGLSSILLLIAYLGQKVTSKLTKISDPKGWFKKTLAIIFILVGLSIIFGIDKKIEAAVLGEGNFYLVEFEESLMVK